MTESANEKELEKQTAGSQHEVQEPQSELPTAADASERLCLRKTVEADQKGVTDQQGTLEEAGDDLPVGLRRSERARYPTDKMRALQEEEAKKREKRLLSMYEKWKPQIRKAREQLKTYMSETELWLLIDELKTSKEAIMNMYFEIRDLTTPSTDLRKRVDTCESVTKEIINIAYDRAIEDEGEFDEKQGRRRLHELLRHGCARSIYGSAVSMISHSKSDHRSVTSSLAAKRVDAAAELAVKESNYEMLLEEERQRESIRELEEQQRKALEARKHELDRLQAEREVQVAQARLKAYSEEMECDGAYYTNNERNKETSNVPVTAVPSPHVTVPSHIDISSLTQVFQDSIALNRLPAPEPFVFSGDPIRFIEWKAAFTSLVDQRAITAAEKLYYLKKYVGGPAWQALDGTFYQNDNEAYQDAWNKLNRRFGQPFTIQRTFRERLSKWPRIQPKDTEGLRNFSDFLNACQDAMPHVKGLDILNDCEENQKLVHKLPDWAASRWNCQVTQSLNEKQEFPTFKDFASFLSTEA
ncbi:uncharacterized protein LOC144459802 [Epinephelus lanceolatus]